MNYYKIIRNGLVIGAGTMWLKWNDRRRAYYYCNLDQAEIAQDIVTEGFYTSDWLRDPPAGAPIVEEAEIIMIDATEFDDIVEQLKDGEDIPVPDPEPKPEPTPDPEPEPEERPMTVQQMRDRIAELTAFVMNEAEPFVAEQTYQTGDIITNGVRRMYIADQVIVRGETVSPGINCTETTMAEVINALKTQNEEA